MGVNSQHERNNAPRYGLLSSSPRHAVLLAVLVILALALGACGRGPQSDAAEQNAAVQVAAERQAQATAQAVRIPASFDGTAAMMAGDVTLENRLIDLYRKANPAVVYIVAIPIGTGSGFLVDAAGHIVTNHHVVAGARTLEVVFADGHRCPARAVGADADGDLAVIQVDTVPTNVAPLPLAAADDIAVGQFVVAIGNPFGEQGSMSLGIVSGLGRSLPSQRATGAGSTYSLPAVIQTDAPINPGNSGGPLLNLDGEVVGVNAAIASATGANSGVGFSIPAAAVRRIVPSLIENGRYVYPYIGAGFDDEVTLAEQNVYGLPQTQGAYVVSVTRGGPAARAGLNPADPNSGRGGDLIVAIDGLPIADFQDLNRYLAFGTAPGQEIQVTLLRNGQTVTLPVTLGERP
jgi:2-alkenal reductase